MILRRSAAVVLLLIFVISPVSLLAQQTPAPAPDPNDPIQRIKDEGMNRSQVMQTLSYLSDVIGPRLTASPGMKRANEWTRDQMTKWGLQNAHLEAWGPFGRGWTLKRFSAQVTEPTATALSRRRLLRRAHGSRVREVQRQAQRKDRFDSTGARRHCALRAAWLTAE
jgi:hypothetical protein